MKSNRPIIRTLLALVLALGVKLGTGSTQAAIAVDGTGSGTLSFDTMPAATEWSTVASIAGNGGTATSPAGLDSLVNTLTAGGISATLGTVTADPNGTTTQDGRWNSAALRLTSRAGTSAATCFMTTLQNVSGEAINELSIRFDLTGSAAAGEDTGLAGYTLYYNLTGTAGSWQRIGGFDTLGEVRANNIALTGSWADGATLYVLWVDDNGNNGGDGWYGFDNVVFAEATPVGPVDDGSSTVVASPTGIPADGSSTATITVALKDADGNPIAGKNVSLAQTGGTGATITTTQGTTNSSGLATFTVKSSTTGAAVFTATDTDDSVTLTQTATVFFQAPVSWGPATNDTLNGGSTAFEAGDVKTDGTFVAAVTNGTGGTLNGVTFQGCTGYSYPNFTYGSSSISLAWVSPNNGYGNPGNAYGQFGYSNGSATKLLLTGGGDIGGSGQVRLGGLTEGRQYQVQIWAPTWNNTLSITVGGVALRIGNPPGTLSQYVVGTFTADGSGVQTIKWTGIAPTAVSLRDISPAPPPDAANSTVAASPPSVASDGVTTSTITVTLRDSAGNPIWGKTVTLASSRGAADTISAASGSSNSSGVVTFAVTSTTPGAAVFTATDVSDGVVVTQTAGVMFEAGAASAGQSTVLASPTTVVADGTSSSAITVTLKDSNNNPISNKNVTLASSRGAADTISPASDVTNASGEVSFTVTSSIPGSPVFTATDTDDSVTVTQTASVDFTVGSVSADASTVVASPTGVPADGSTASTITVTLKDAYGHAIPGKAVELTQTGGTGATINPAGGVSNSSGVVTFTVKSSTVGAAVFTATDTDDSLPLTQTATVHFQSAITWGPATDDTLNGDSTAFVDTDVKTDGTFVAAVTNGNGGTVNGVTFTGWTSYSGPPNGIITYGTSPISLRWTPDNPGNRNQWGSPSNKYGNFGYDNGSSNKLLLTGGGEGNSPGTITLGSLVAGHSYQIQIWAPTWNNTFGITVGGVGLRIGNPPGTVSQHVIGTFTADESGIQTIPWSGIAPSAISLRDLTGGSASDYASWAAAQDPPLTGGPDAVGPDGLKNLLIYALDGLKTDHTNGAPGTLTGNVLTFTKRAEAVANGDVSYAIEISADLGVNDAWHTATTGVTEVIGPPATISVDLSALGGSTHFARLKVTQ